MVLAPAEIMRPLYRLDAAVRRTHVGCEVGLLTESLMLAPSIIGYT